MRKNAELERRRAVERYRDGESPSVICASLGHSREWFYKWLRRFEFGDADRFRDRSRRPYQSPASTSQPSLVPVHKVGF